MDKMIIDDPLAPHRAVPSCAWEGCPMPGRFAPQLRIPAKGLAINRVKPLRMICKVVLCDQHIGKVPVSVLLTDALKGDFIKAAASVGTLTPDFERAWVGQVSINSPEYRKYLRNNPDAPDVLVPMDTAPAIDVVACINRTMDAIRRGDE